VADSGYAKHEDPRGHTLVSSFGPSYRFLWASSAFILFECGLRSLVSFSLGQHHLHILRVDEARAERKYGILA
jgi:hypothetical protein